MDTPAELPPEALLAHAAGLRALARGLLGDEHAVEDVLQETWLVALQRAPELRAGLGGWLRAVTRGLALKRRRGEGRRYRRERTVALEREPFDVSPDEALAEREVLHAVAEAVASLDEPYRGLVVDRYWRARSPRAIADERGVPSATVAAQLGRARQLLERRLDARVEGSRERWAGVLAACVGRVDDGPKTAPTARSVPDDGGARMLVTKGLVVAGAVALVAWWASVGIAPAKVPQARSVAQEAASPSTDTGAAIDAPAQAGEARRAVGAVAVEPAASTNRVLFGTVVDQRDHPLAKARVLVALPGAPWNEVARTDGRGRFRAVLEGLPVPARLLVRVELKACWDAADRELVLGPEPERELAFSLENGVFTLAADHDALEAAEDAGDATALAAARARFEAASERMRRRGPSRSCVEARALHDGRLRLGWPPPETEEIFEETTVGKAVGVSRPSAPEPGLEGTLRDEEGRPVAGAWVVALTEPFTRTTRSRSDGSYSISAPPGTEIVAGGGPQGRAYGVVPEAAESPARWDAVLERGLELRGRLVDEAGRGLAGWRVEVEADDPPFADAIETDADGRFALPNQPERALRLSVVRRATNPFAVVAAEGVRPGPGEHEVTLDARARRTGTLAVAVLAPDGSPVEDAEVRVRQLASGRGARMVRVGAAHELDALPPGRYRVEVTSQAFGALDLGVVGVDEGRTELDPAVLPAPGRLAWDPPLAPATAWSLERLVDGCALPVADGAAPDEPPAVAAGTYRVRLGPAEPVDVVVPAGGRARVATPR